MSAVAFFAITGIIACVISIVVFCIALLVESRKTETFLKKICGCLLGFATICALAAAIAGAILV